MTFSAESLRATLEAHVPARASGLVVALSGGGDSAALLAATVACGPLFGRLPLRAVHVDHGLQSAASEFRAACAAQCARLNIPLTVIPVVVAALDGASIEAAAREARYAALEAEMSPGECLLTAHHEEDQATTLLLQGLRGAGVKGMSAMPLRKSFGLGWHLRPVLDVRQAELIGFGALSHAPTSLDPMNEDLRFDRVYLRRQVWPLIEARWPGAAHALSRSARHLAEAQDVLDSSAATDVARLRDGEALSVPGLRSLDEHQRLHAVRYWLRGAGVEPPSTARITEALRQMFEADVDHMPAVVWGSHALRRYRQRLFVTDADPPRLERSQQWAVQTNAGLELGPRLGRLRWVAQAGGIAAAQLPHTVRVGPRQGGEALKPAALARTQSVQHLCQSLGVLPWRRDALPLVFAADELIAVADLWSSAAWHVAAQAPGLGLVWEDAPIIV